MKIKKLIGFLLIVLMMFSVLIVSCSGDNVVPTPTPTPDPGPNYNDPNNPEHNGTPVLPKGSVALRGNKDSIPMDWSVNPNGMKDLPAVTYSFEGTATSTTNVTKELKDAIAAAQANPDFFDETPKKVLFLFSDGWGVTEVKMSREYKGELVLDYLPNATESMTDSYLKYSFTNKDNVNSNYSSKTTTDSCAGGSQVLTGYKTRYGYIALDVDGNKIPNLAEAAKDKGWYVACVTNDNIVDATPADCIIHDTNRYHDAVLYYKALMATDWDLLMGWDWGMGSLFDKEDKTPKTWEERFLETEKEGIKDAQTRAAKDDFEKRGLPAFSADFNNDGVEDRKDPIDYFKSLTPLERSFMAGFSVYYSLWEAETGKLNSFMTWTSTGSGDLAQYVAWLESPTGLQAAIEKVESEYGAPNSKVNRFTSFKDLLANTSFDKPILGSWETDGNDYEDSKPNRGYLLHGSVGKSYPSWPEMVAYTIYQMDKQAGADGNFFALIENTCTDGWGHSGNYDTKYIGMMNEVQCFDEGVAIAVKYVLEHPDTLLVVSADHETGGYTLRAGWEDDISLIKSGTTGHSSQNVPLYAFGAGAQKFSAEAILAAYGDVSTAHVSSDGKVHEGWITGAIIGELITGETFGQLSTKTPYNGQ